MSPLQKNKMPKGLQTRQEILCVAVRLFSLHGYHQTSTADILQAASISKGAFYHHFKSKEDLALEALKLLQEDYQSMVIEPTMAAAPSERFHRMLDTIVQLNQSGAWPHCLLLGRLVQETASIEGALSEQVGQTVAWLLDRWETVIRDGQEAGVLQATIHARVLAQILFSSLTGALFVQQLNTSSADPAALAELLEKLTIK